MKNESSNFLEMTELVTRLIDRFDIWSNSENINSRCRDCNSNMIMTRPGMTHFDN